MSTRLTKRNIPMVESQSLKLVFAASAVSDSITGYLAAALVEQGYVSVTPSVLSFLGSLECDVNYGSEVARNLGVSRQMVAKTVKSLSELGYLEQVDGEGRQKQIVFTELGELLMSDARHVLAKMDGQLSKVLGVKNLQKLIASLAELQTVLPD